MTIAAPVEQTDDHAGAELFRLLLASADWRQGEPCMPKRGNAGPTRTSDTSYANIFAYSCFPLGAYVRFRVSTSQGIDVQNGPYLLSFSADGYSSRGHATVAGRTFRGSDGCYRVTGDVFKVARKLEGVVVVYAVARGRPSAHMPDSFVLRVTGDEQADGVSLVGAGQLGIILQLQYQRIKPHHEPLEPRDEDM